MLIKIGIERKQQLYVHVTVNNVYRQEKDFLFFIEAFIFVMSSII